MKNFVKEFMGVFTKDPSRSVIKVYPKPLPLTTNSTSTTTNMSGIYTGAIATTGIVWASGIVGGTGGTLSHTNPCLEIDLNPPEQQVSKTLVYMKKSLEEKDYENLKKWAEVLNEELKALEY